MTLDSHGDAEPNQGRIVLLHNDEMEDGNNILCSGMISAVYNNPKATPAAAEAKEWDQVLKASCRPIKYVIVLSEK